MGRFLDLYAYHTDYINCKDVPIQYVSQASLLSQDLLLKIPWSFRRLPYLAFLDLLAKGKVDAHVTKKSKGSDVYFKSVLHLTLSSVNVLSLNGFFCSGTSPACTRIFFLSCLGLARFSM